MNRGVVGGRRFFNFDFTARRCVAIPLESFSNGIAVNVGLGDVAVVVGLDAKIGVT